MLKTRGIEGVRVLLGLLDLSGRHNGDQIEQTCQTAVTHGADQLRSIRKLIKQQGPEQQQFEFIDQYPIIRTLDEYDQFVQTAFTNAGRSATHE